jgi:hypothetical protein
MRLTILSVLLFTTSVLAQENSRFEAYGGYSFGYQKRDRLSLYGANNGWIGAFKVNLNDRIGVLGEAGGQFDFGRTAPRRTQTYLFGPEFNALRTRRLAVNFRATAGFIRDSNEQFFANPTSAFASSFGGNLDIRLSEHLSWRVLQPEVLFTKFGNRYEPNLRASTGLVFHFGR